MKKKQFLDDYVKICDLHASRLNDAQIAVKKMLPLTPEKFENLPSENVAHLDMMALRFSQLQDVMGSKIFPLTLDLLGEDGNTLIDKLNKLEKIGYIDDANWWMSLRKMRNDITHDYPDEYESLSLHFNKLVALVEQLLTFWNSYKTKITPLMK